MDGVGRVGGEVEDYKFRADFFGSRLATIPPPSSSLTVASRTSVCVPCSSFCCVVCCMYHMGLPLQG